MRRHLLSLFAASVLAAYLVPAFYAGFRLLKGGNHMAADDYIALVGTAGAIFLSLPTVLISGLLVFLLRIAGLYGRRNVVLTATLLGACFVGGIFLDTPDALAFSCSGALSGAICGFLYWRLAAMASGQQFGQEPRHESGETDAAAKPKSRKPKRPLSTQRGF